MTYTHTTLGTGKSILADQMGDPLKRFHTDAELGSALIEVLRIWNAITQFCRERGTFATTANQPFYALSTTLKDSGANLLRAQTVRDRTLLSEIEFHLMENQAFTAWAGTDQFTLSQLLSAIQTSRNQFLADTGCTVSSYAPVAVFGSGDGQVTLTDDVIGIRRAVYHTLSGRYITLRRTSEHIAVSNSGQWTSPGIPSSYSVSATPQLTVQIIPPPEEGGSLELLVVKNGADVNVTANSNVGTLLSVPDDFTWAVKYGALAALYSNQSSIAPERMDRCKQLYDLGVQLCKMLPVVLYAELDGVVTLPASLAMTDMRQAGWQGYGSSTPKMLSIAGPDYIALTPQPDSNSHGVLLTVVRNAIVPSSVTADTEYLNIGREQLSAVFGMAQHILALKLPGDLYQGTFPLADAFFEQAGKYALRRSAASTALQSMLSYTSKEHNIAPWEHSPSRGSNDKDETRQERNSRRRTFRWKQ